MKFQLDYFGEQEYRISRGVKNIRYILDKLNNAGPALMIFSTFQKYIRFFKFKILLLFVELVIQISFKNFNVF